MRKLLILILLMLPAYLVSADISGTGCKIGQGYVYTEYLGSAPAYTGTAPIKYYKSNGAKIPIYWGNGHNQYQGYRCGYINSYPASSYYDYDTKTNVPIPAENEFSYLGEQCVISPYLGGPPISTDSYVSYSYMKTSKCSTDQTPVPLDDYVWVVIVGIGALSTFFIRNRLMCPEV
ncbi:hypothetical protein [Pedobacter insulae]|nr:hypothetical protein [Pedobacter insulae]